MATSLLVTSILLGFLATACFATEFSTLPQTLVVTASPTSGQVLKAGEQSITVTWSLNQTGVDSSYKTVKAKLCYAPESQTDRPWRKTVNEIAKDKTCQHAIASKPYAATNNSVTWLIQKDVPTATYFVRVYVYDSNDTPLGYGQSTDDKKTKNLFSVAGISGRHASLEIASACFSAFSIVSLFGFFYLEKRKAKSAK
ncbi:high-affinity nitrate transporter 3.1-like [Impatiens glandulifera]|uniref:high-affinity nitrate transporter 3.1-like n=1 Tax=Impatiens glandulifera TaxID=253017 RepID=UPI001FB0EB6D|nr:high-affinity nitrate transporter 3.1-like [Impatiens glandulifera]